MGSKNLVQMLSKLGICSSYKEVQILEASLIMAPLEVIEPRTFCQFVFDNCDFNVNSIDGYNTFHNMAGIKCITPASCITYPSDVIERHEKLKKSAIVDKKGIVELRVFEKKDGMGLKNLLFENLDDLFPSKKSDDIPSVYDVLWMCGKWKTFENIAGWQGYMETITCNETFDQTKIQLLPFIIAPPSDYNTVYTSLMMAVEKSKEMQIQTTFVTFDQPLYMTAVDIQLSAEPDSELSNVIIRLGGFHLVMSFLGCIGFIMKGSGLKELLSTIYAPNSVDKMLTGHAYARAIRGHLLVQLSLAKCILNDINFSDEECSVIADIFSNFEEHPPERKALEEIHLLHSITKKFKQLEKLEENSPTAKLWVQYFKMVSLLKKFIEAERTGDWEKHLYAMKLMIPYFHASGHFPYAKSCQIYLQSVAKLKEKMSISEYNKFVTNGFFTIRRKDKFFSGTWTDMCIEQTANKGFKVKGGVIYRGFTDDILTAHVVAGPTLHNICEALEEFCGSDSGTSEQHIESRESRIKRNDADVGKLDNWLTTHSPFTTGKEIMSLSSGIVGDKKINCHKAKEIGDQCTAGIIGKLFKDIKLKRSNTVLSLATVNSAVKVHDKLVPIDPFILFQRMLIAKKHDDDLAEFFKFELAPYPLSMFNDTTGMRKTKKSAVYDMFHPIDLEESLPSTNDIYVIDGGFLLHRVIWQTNQTYGEICARYVDYVENKFGKNSIIVFDGYENDSSIKKAEQHRRYLHSQCVEIIFDESIMATVNQNKFLSNDKNKIRLISLLTKFLQNRTFMVKQAIDDADTLIVKTAIEMSNNGRTFVVGEDVDLLVLLIALTPEDKDIFLMKPGTGKINRKIFSSSEIQKSYQHIKDKILLAHAFSGCDTTSSIFQKGKLQIFKLLLKEFRLDDVVKTFNDENSTQSEVRAAGETLFLMVYGAKKNRNISLDSYRFDQFKNSLQKQKSRLELLPPTSQAAAQHSSRVFYQIQLWLGNKKNPEQWGWKKVNGSLQPITTLLQPAPESILQLISCNCTTDCSSRCGCRKAGLRCSEICGHCQGMQCLNAYMEPIGENLHDSEDIDSIQEHAGEELQDIFYEADATDTDFL